MVVLASFWEIVDKLRIEEDQYDLAKRQLYSTFHRLFLPTIITLAYEHYRHQHIHTIQMGVVSSSICAHLVPLLYEHMDK